MIVKNEVNERDQVLTWDGETSRKGISGITEIADADGAVTDYSALCVYTTRVRARRYTLLIDASKILRALAVHYAFSSTVGRAADKIRKASANGKAIYVSAFTIWSTGRWAARIYFWQYCVEKNIIMYYSLWIIIGNNISSSHVQIQNIIFFNIINFALYWDSY